MTLKGGTSQACAACKYQRRKCSSECPLAPYFPPDHPKLFQNAHRLFGVSNILKILKQLDPAQKLAAMQSIIFQAGIRDLYPVSGCLGLICQLRHEIRQAEEELQLVLSQIEICRHRHHHHHQLHIPSNDTSSSSSLELGTSVLSLHHNPPQEYDALSVTGTGIGGAEILPVGAGPCAAVPFSFDFLDPKESSLNSVWPQNSYTSITHNDDIQNPLTIQPEPLQPHAAAAAENYDEMHPFFDTFDEGQSSTYVDSREAAYESSSESSLRDTALPAADNVAENELKSAAACFSLISLGQ